VQSVAGWRRKKDSFPHPIVQHCSALKRHELCHHFMCLAVLNRQKWKLKASPEWVEDAFWAAVKVN